MPIFFLATYTKEGWISEIFINPTNMAEVEVNKMNRINCETKIDYSLCPIFIKNN